MFTSYAVLASQPLCGSVSSSMHAILNMCSEHYQVRLCMSGPQPGLAGIVMSQQRCVSSSPSPILNPSLIVTSVLYSSYLTSNASVYQTHPFCASLMPALLIPKARGNMTCLIPLARASREGPWEKASWEMVVICRSCLGFFTFS